jgi:hypothetical protein
MANLLTKCNADVYKAILDLKEESPINGEKLIAILQAHEYLWQITLSEMLVFSAYLPWPIWDRKVHTFYILFQSQQTTVMP